MSPSVQVRIDDRLRLAGALLAAGDWPEREQAAKAYKPHRVAEQAHRHFAPHSSHAAVVGAAALVGEGAGLNLLYTHALNGNWPADWGNHLAGFREATKLEEFWNETHADWFQAEGDARDVLARADLGQFLDDLLGPQTRALVFFPNLLFPGRQPVVVGAAGEVVVCAPPPLAWGTSPPWRYSERPDEVLAAVSEGFARFLFEDGLPPEHAALKPQAEAFALAAAVLFLRQAEGQAAGDQFMVMEKKTRGLPHLPALVAALEALLADRRAGRLAGLADYAPQLAAHLGTRPEGG
jgi:hypothetical protein